MSQHHSALTLSIRANTDVQAFVFLDFDGSIPPAAGRAAGIARTAGKAGDLLPVDVLGTSIAIAGADIAVGQRLEVGANGQAVPLASGIAVAAACEAAEAGQSFEVSLIPN